MKLIIQIPCFNEETSLPITLKELPKSIPNVDVIETLIIDDGSKDNTVEVAKKNGVDHIITHQQNRGLAKTFMTGIDACLARGADIIVNTDADNQYYGEDIIRLIEPIISNDAEIVIGSRPIAKTAHFSPIKKFLQKVGSRVVRIVSNTEIQDAPSGFRAFSRYAASQLNVFSEYTYTLETIIQAGHKGISIKSIPIRTNKDLRPSRLVKNIRIYIQRSILTMLRIFVVYKPFRFFTSISLLFFTIGLVILTRYLGLYFSGDGDGHIQSILLGMFFLVTSIQIIFLGFVADLQSVNRKLLEQIKSILSK